MKQTFLIVFAIVTGLMLTAPVGATQTKHPARVLFTNVHIFDGKAEKRILNANVLVEGNLIKQVSPTPISGEGAKVIEGDGRTLMPGMIDAHWRCLQRCPCPSSCNRT